MGYFYRIERVESEVPYDVVIPEGVEMVGTENWSGECSVGSVRVPDSMRYISDYAFYRCEKLRSVRYPQPLCMRDGGGSMMMMLCIPGVWRFWMRMGTLMG